MTKNDLIDYIQQLEYRLIHGCGNHGCCINSPKLGTNATCKCDPYNIQRFFQRIVLNLNDNIENGNKWE